MVIYNQNSKKSFGSNKINTINWRYDDQFLLISGYENFYEWQLPIKNDYTKRYEQRNYNISCGVYIANTFNTVFFTDDGYVRKLNADSIVPYADYKSDYNIKEMIMLKQNKFMVCCTQINTKKNNNNIGGPTSNNNSVGNWTSCLRLFYDINTKEDYLDIPSHFGETTRVRINYDENLIFTCGSDGCVNIYSLETIQDSEDDNKFYLEKFSDNFTSTVLIRKSKLKEKELEKLDLPEKREERLKKVKLENLEKKEKLQRDLDSIKSNIVSTKQTELKLIGQKKKRIRCINIRLRTKNFIEKISISI